MPAPYGGRNPQHPPEKTLTQTWPGYLQDGYFDAQGNLKPEYVSRDKVQPLVQEMNQASPRLTTHQIRRFFQHCRAIEAKLKARSSTWGAEEARFRKLDVAAADSFGKANKKIPRIFHDFIEENVAIVRTEKDFLEGFLPHFEAVVGFGSQFFQERERR